MRHGDLRRLEKLETSTREQYEHAFRRAKLRVARHLGAVLTYEETVLLGGGSEAGDAETLRRYRASLPEKEAKREGGALLSWAYRETERRGVDPWGKADFAGFDDELEARGFDASGVQWFSE